MLVLKIDRYTIDGELLLVGRYDNSIPAVIYSVSGSCASIDSYKVNIHCLGTHNENIKFYAIALDDYLEVYIEVAIQSRISIISATKPEIQEKEIPSGAVQITVN